jgi:hypothetical protein
MTLIDYGINNYIRYLVVRGIPKSIIVNLLISISWRANLMEIRMTVIFKKCTTNKRYTQCVRKVLRKVELQSQIGLSHQNKGIHIFVN